MDITMRGEFLSHLPQFSLGFVAEGRVLYSNPHGDMVAHSASTSGKSHKNSDSGFKSGKNNTTSLSSKNYNEVNSSPWEFDNFLRGGQDINNDPSTEFWANPLFDACHVNRAAGSITIGYLTTKNLLI